jgi:hypothetical protein
MDQQDWLLSSMPVISQGVLLDLSVNSDFSHGWA